MVFAERRGFDTVRSLFLSCGQCVGCRLERSRQWAVRCMHEASLYEDNCFVTLTYERSSVSLRYRDFQLFMKRLRKVAGRVRFYMCGEYGEAFGRPHFHVCLFGYDFPDRVYLSKTGSGFKLYRSALLESLWRFGFSSVGAVTFESAAYVARYVMKKVTGPGAARHYECVDVGSGEIVSRVPEFNKMSLRPGIGAAWLRKFQSDVYPHGAVVVNGHQARPPRYYDKVYEREAPDEHAFMMFGRDVDARSRFADNSDARLLAKEQVTLARVGLLKRSIQ